MADTTSPAVDAPAVDDPSPGGSRRQARGAVDADRTVSIEATAAVGKANASRAGTAKRSGEGEHRSKRKMWKEEDLRVSSRFSGSLSTVADEAALLDRYLGIEIAALFGASR